MSKNLFFNRRFWQDQYISDLDPVEKLVFVYLITNPYCGLTGIYELPVKYAAFETGLDTEMVRKIMQRLHDDGKVFVSGSWVCVRNYPKYQKFSGVKLEKGIINELKTIPSHILLNFIELGYPIDTLSILSSDSDSVSDSNNRLEKIKKLIMSWTKYSDDYELGSIDADGDGSVQEEKKPRTRKYPNAPAVRKVFLEVLGKNPADWNRNTTVLQACENLYTERGLDKIKNALLFYREHQDEEFCPVINTPVDLDRKYTNLSRFKTKQ